MIFVLNFIPITTDMNKYLSTDCSYENMVTYEQLILILQHLIKKVKKNIYLLIMIKIGQLNFNFFCIFIYLIYTLLL